VKGEDIQAEKEKGGSADAEAAVSFDGAEARESGGSR